MEAQNESNAVPWARAIFSCYEQLLQILCLFVLFIFNGSDYATTISFE